jgi:hypothetical protein
VFPLYQGEKKVNSLIWRSVFGAIFWGRAGLILLDWIRYFLIPFILHNYPDEN